MVSPYDVLGVDSNASSESIEEAYRELVKEKHPDHGGSQREFLLVQKAHEEIKSERQVGKEGSKNRRKTGHRGHQDSQARTQSEENQLQCSNCGSKIDSLRTSVKREKTGEIFCQDCVVRTDCDICGKFLLLTSAQYSNLEGEPICNDCGPISRNSRTGTTNRGGGTGSPGGRQLSCANCDSTIVNPGEAIKREKTGNVFCKKCVVNTNCVKCNKSLTLSPFQFSNLNGNPVCKACQAQPRKKGRNLVSAISLWLMAILGILVIVFIASAAPNLNALIQPSPSTRSTLEDIVPVIIGPGTLIILWHLLKRD